MARRQEVVVPYLKDSTLGVAFGGSEAVLVYESRPDGWVERSVFASTAARSMSLTQTRPGSRSVTRKRVLRP